MLLGVATKTPSIVYYNQKHQFFARGIVAFLANKATYRILKSSKIRRSADFRTNIHKFKFKFISSFSFTTLDAAANTRFLPEYIYYF